MKLAYAPPPADLAEYLSAFYLFESDEGDFEDIERASVAQFRITFNGEGELAFPAASPQPIPSASIVGPRLTSCVVRARGKPIRMFGVGLLPAGWIAFTAMGADQFVNQVVPVETIFGDSGSDYLTRMSKLDDLQSMVDLTSAVTRRFVASAGDVNVNFIRTVNAWLEAGLDPKVDELAAAAKLSRRQTERLAKHCFGAPPKYLARMYRALRAANGIANSDQHWQDFVNEAFYDQSHFIREIKHFTGLTPSAIRDHQSRLTQLAFGRHQLAGEVSSLVADS